MFIYSCCYIYEFSLLCILFVYIFLFLYLCILLLCIIIFIFVYFYFYILLLLCLYILIVMYVPFYVFCFIMLFYVLFSCKCVLYCTALYCCLRVSTQLQLKNISYIIPKGFINLNKNNTNKNCEQFCIFATFIIGKLTHRFVNIQILQL
jgi:hypothetical protein